MRIHVSLPEDLKNKVQKSLDEGDYITTSELVRDALRGLFDKKGW